MFTCSGVILNLINCALSFIRIWSKRCYAKVKKKYSTYLNWSLFLDILQAFIVVYYKHAPNTFPHIILLCYMWKNSEHQENELAKRAMKSDIALSSNVSFISILFFPNSLPGRSKALQRGYKCCILKIQTQKQIYSKCS